MRKTNVRSKIKQATEKLGYENMWERNKHKETSKKERWRTK